MKDFSILLVAIACSACGMEVDAVGTPTHQARFENVQGLDVGSPVRMRGARVGEVVAVTLDATLRDVAVSFRIDDEHQAAVGVFGVECAAVRRDGTIDPPHLDLRDGGGSLGETIATCPTQGPQDLLQTLGGLFGGSRGAPTPAPAPSMGGLNDIIRGIFGAPPSARPAPMVPGTPSPGQP